MEIFGNIALLVIGLTANLIILVYIVKFIQYCVTEPRFLTYAAIVTVLFSSVYYSVVWLMS
jgi:hypothetical protein